MEFNNEQEFIWELANIEDLFNNNKISSNEAFLLRTLLTHEKYLREGGSYKLMKECILKR